MDSLPPIPITEQEAARRKRRARVWLIFFTVLILAFVIISICCPGMIADYVKSISPGCTFRKYTGIACPGCGGTRAAGALLHGDIIGAFQYNLLLPIGIFALAVEYVRLIIINFTRAKDWVYSRVYVRFFQFYALLVVAWFILRNIFGI